MSTGNIKTLGSKGSNFSFQFNVLKSIGRVIDIFTNISNILSSSTVNAKVINSTGTGTIVDSNVNFNLKVEIVDGENIFQITIPDQRGTRILPEIISIPLTTLSSLTLSEINSTASEIVFANVTELVKINISEFEIIDPNEANTTTE